MPFAVRSVQKDKIGPGGDKVIHLVGLIVNVVVAGFGLEFDAWIDLFRRSLGSVRDLDEKWVAKISDGYRHGTKLFLR